MTTTGSGDYAFYDPDAREILYHVTAVHDIADIELPVDFTLAARDERAYGL